MDSFNIFEPELEQANRPDGWNWRYARVGKAIGASKLGATIYELPPGGRSFPYHYEYPEEEWVIVLAGEPTLRTPEGERRLRPGDAVCFPEGPDGAHQVRNDTDAPSRVMILSTKLGSPAVAVYPDSGKVLIDIGESGDSGIFRQSDKVDYWDGES
jgi:uncharacterized cupin superfamily protein